MRLGRALNEAFDYIGHHNMLHRQHKQAAEHFERAGPSVGPERAKNDAVAKAHSELADHHIGMVVRYDNLRKAEKKLVGSGK